MLTKIKSEGPLPTPFSVIISPSHITNMDPAARAKVVEAMKANSLVVLANSRTQKEMPMPWIMAQPKVT